MKFKFIKQVAGSVQSYGGNVVKTGDIIELDGHLARKAAASPDYETVPDAPPEPESTQAAEEPESVVEQPETTDDDQGERGDDMASLREAYKEKFGAYPHHRKSVETIKAELNGNQG